MVPVLLCLTGVQGIVVGVPPIKLWDLGCSAHVPYAISSLEAELGEVVLLEHLKAAGSFNSESDTSPPLKPLWLVGWETVMQGFPAHCEAWSSSVTPRDVSRRFQMSHRKMVWFFTAAELQEEASSHRVVKSLAPEVKASEWIIRLVFRSPAADSVLSRGPLCDLWICCPLFYLGIVLWQWSSVRYSGDWEVFMTWDHHSQYAD